MGETPTSPATIKKGFAVALVEWLTVATPSLVALRLMTMDLPPIADHLMREYGPVVLVLLIIGGLVWRFVPRDVLSARNETQRMQAVSQALMATALQNLVGPAGFLEKLQEATAIIITNQSVIIAKMDELKADYARIDATLESRNVIFREMEILLAEIRALTINPTTPRGAYQISRALTPELKEE